MLIVNEIRLCSNIDIKRVTALYISYDLIRHKTESGKETNIVFLKELEEKKGA